MDFNQSTLYKKNHLFLAAQFNIYILEAAIFILWL